MLKKDKSLDFTYWNNNINDLLYDLEKNDHVQLDVFNGKIQSIIIKLL